MDRLPPALAASATSRLIELLGPPPGRVLELGFAGIHAEPLRLAGFDVVVVELDPAYRERARERADDVLEAPPGGSFDAVIAPAGTDLTGIDASRVLLIERDGSIVG
jgi:hypothetical protein